MRKYALKASLSFLLALGMVTVAQGRAQAGEIKVEGSATLATGTTVSGEQIGASKLSVPTLGIYVECQKFSVTEGKILSGPAGEALARIVFEECQSFTNGGEKLPCVIEDGGLGGTAEDITAKVLISTALHENRTYPIPMPDGEVHLAVLRNGGSECNLPRNVEIKGSTAFKLATGDLLVGAEVMEPEIESSQAIAELFEPEALGNHSFFYGIQKAYIFLKAKLKLLGSMIGKLWGGK